MRSLFLLRTSMYYKKHVTQVSVKKQNMSGVDADVDEPDLVELTPPGSLQRTKSVWMERSRYGDDDQHPEDEAGGSSPSEGEEEEEDYEMSIEAELVIDDDEVKIGEPRFSHPVKRPGLMHDPIGFVEASNAPGADQEVDISGDQALQYELFKRLPIPEKCWAELVEDMAAEWRAKQQKRAL